MDGDADTRSQPEASSGDLWSAAMQLLNGVHLRNNFNSRP